MEWGLLQIEDDKQDDPQMATPIYCSSDELAASKPTPLKNVVKCKKNLYNPTLVFLILQSNPSFILTLLNQI